MRRLNVKRGREIMEGATFSERYDDVGGWAVSFRGAS